MAALATQGNLLHTSRMTTKSFNLILPASSSEPTSTVQIECKGSMVILGANGSGKTRLGAWLELQSEHKENAHRISAQKSLTMPSIAASMSVDDAESLLLYGHRDRKAHYKPGHRWGNNPNVFLLDDFERLLTYLFSEENETNTKYRQAAKGSKERIEPPETKLDIIQRIWEQVLPQRKLRIGGGKIDTVISEKPDVVYNAANMSDGERVIFYLIGQALSAPKRGILIIDEPELHLHKSIQSINTFANQAGSSPG